MNVDLYNKAIDELKNNFNNKYLVILDRNNASIVYKGCLLYTSPSPRDRG